MVVVVAVTAGGGAAGSAAALGEAGVAGVAEVAGVDSFTAYRDIMNLKKFVASVICKVLYSTVLYRWYGYGTVQYCTVYRTTVQNKKIQ